MDDLIYRLLNIIDDQLEQINKLTEIISPTKTTVTDNQAEVVKQPIQIGKSARFYGPGGLQTNLEHKYSIPLDEKEKYWREQADLARNELLEQETLAKRKMEIDTLNGVNDDANDKERSGGTGERGDESSKEEKEESIR
jgi:hypothetical protein